MAPAFRADDRGHRRAHVCVAAFWPLGVRTSRARRGRAVRGRHGPGNDDAATRHDAERTIEAVGIARAAARSPPRKTGKCRSPMNVVHIVPAPFGPRGVVGGAERYAFELARQMADRVPTTLVTFGEERREEHAGALRVRTIGNPWFVRGQRTNPFSLEVFREMRDAD